MKKKFLNYCIDVIKNNGVTDEEKIENIRYGLEAIYLTFTKLIVIFLIAYLLGILKYCLLLLLCFNIVRSSSFGIHAKKSSHCLISSIILFIGGVFLSNIIIKLNIYIKIIASIICVLCLCVYAPADTINRPLINKRKRLIYKIRSVIIGCIYLCLIFIYNKNLISGYLLVGLIEAVIMILPITYKFFKMPYNNYKKYGRED